METTFDMANFRVDVPEGEIGNWKVSKFTIVPGDRRVKRDASKGRPIPLGTYTMLEVCGATMMTDTPAEIMDSMSFILKARDRVIINGLGLGVVPGILLHVGLVTHIDIVENSEDVIALVGPSIVDSRVTIHHADAFDIRWPRGTKWHSAFHDIWPTICSDNLPEMYRLEKKYKSRVKRQESWLKAQCMQQLEDW